MARWKPRLSIDAADTVWFPALGRVVDADEAALGHVLTALQLPGVAPARRPVDERHADDDGREALQLARRLEAPHLAFTLTRQLVRDFCAVVRILVRTVDHRRHHRAARRRVTAELVRDQPARDTALPFQQFSKEAHGSAAIRCFRHQLLLRRPEARSRPGAVENRPGTTHVIAPMLTNINGPSGISVGRKEPG